MQIPDNQPPPGKLLPGSNRIGFRPAWQVEKDKHRTREERTGADECECRPGKGSMLNVLRVRWKLEIE